MNDREQEAPPSAGVVEAPAPAPNEAEGPESHDRPPTHAEGEARRARVLGAIQRFLDRAAKEQGQPRRWGRRG